MERKCVSHWPETQYLETRQKNLEPLRTAVANTNIAPAQRTKQHQPHGRIVAFANVRPRPQRLKPLRLAFAVSS